MWCLIWPIGSHPCIILHVCICLVSGRLRWTELIDAQLIVLIVSFDHEYLFFMHVVSAGVRCASYIDFLLCAVIQVFPIRSIAREPLYGGVSMLCWVGDGAASRAILDVSVAITLHAMFICTFIGVVRLWGSGWWGSHVGFGVGSGLWSGFVRGCCGCFFVLVVGWLKTSWSVCLFGALVS